MIKKVIILFLTIAILALGLYSLYLNQLITDQFETNRWSLPAKIYARVLDIFPGKRISVKEIEYELYQAGYRRDKVASTQGSFSRTKTHFHIVLRDYFFPNGSFRKAKSVKLILKNGKINKIIDLKDQSRIPILALEPPQIDTIFPLLNEDRILISEQEVPELLQKSLLAIEDQYFFQHPGIDPLGIIRAMWINLQTGQLRQGGSTLTQQLVKNYFLSHEKSLQRKLKEALMALLLELNYTKKEIITAYINEVFLAQNGRKAIHGFGLAAQYFFKRKLTQLSLPQIALLVGLVKGPSYYNPRRHPQRAKKRRNVVLKVLHRKKIISDAEYKKYIKAPLGISRNIPRQSSQYSAFMDLLKIQLKQHYDSKQLMTEGLKIYTTLDPRIQNGAQKNLTTAIKKISQHKRLQAAMVITRRDTADVLAIIGSKNRNNTYFNRAVYAKRSIGSLVKPAVYLAALENGYDNTTTIEDSPIQLTTAQGDTWRPQNFDRRSHGNVSLQQSLSQSYNLATVKLGLDIGLNKIADTIKNLGYEKKLALYPADLLGAIAMTPIQVQQIYQSIADGGYYTPLKTIRAVVNKDNKILQQLSINVEKRFNHDSMTKLNTMLHDVVNTGTAKALKKYFKSINSIMAKTGTTNANRDSWFVGYDRNYIATVWLGNDDNLSTRITGATGALKVWAAVKKNTLKD